MSIQASKFVVRFAAAVTVLVCGSCLTYLAAGIYGEMFRQSRTHINSILFILLWGLLPCWFIWESVRAWRLLPKGIESVAAGFLLLGLVGMIFSLAQIVFYRGWQSISVLEAAASSLFLLVLGVTVGLQQRRFSQ